MAISDDLQTLITAFIFGSLFQTAIAALFVYLKGHGSTIFKDRQRLVLVMFLKSSALWVQIDFINFALPSSSVTACQATVIVSTLFDQAARVIFGGFLLWMVGHVRKSKAESYGLGALIVGRTIAGGIFVGYTRPQFAPVCVARSSMLAVSITVIALDLIIIGVLIIRGFSLGLVVAIREIRSTTRQEQSKALLFCLAGFALWTLSSAAMLVGIGSFILLLRTALPAVGLMVLILILTTYPGALLRSLEEDLRTPEARSPFVVTSSRSIESFGDINSSLIPNNEFPKTRKFFITKLSSRTGSVRNVVAQTDSRVGGGVGTTNLSSIVGGVETGNINATPSGYGSAPAFGSRIFNQAVKTGSVEQPRDLMENGIATAHTHQKRSFFGRSKDSGKGNSRGLTISGPVTDDTEILPAHLMRMRTVDLATAAASERERREMAANRQLIAQRPAPHPPSTSAFEALQKASSTKRKEMPKLPHEPDMSTATSFTSSSDSRLSVEANANSTSASLSPGAQDVRRRSPRTLQSQSLYLDKSDKKGVRTQAGVNGLPANPRQPSLRRKEVNHQSRTYVKSVVSDQPGMVKSVINGAPTTLVEPKMGEEEYATTSPKTSKSPTSTLPDPIIHRPRPQRQNSVKERALFPSDPSPHHKRTKSSSSITSVRTPLSSHPKRKSDFAVRSLPSPVPTSASRLRKLLPNDTRSMTVDEKISLLFPAPPGARSMHKRGSSVPSLPHIPSGILLSEQFSTFLTEQELQDRRSSKRTTVSFDKHPLAESTTPLESTPTVDTHQKYRFSAGSYRTAIQAPDSSMMPAVPANFPTLANLSSADVRVLRADSRRRSGLSESDSETEASHDDSKSAWASLHSPTPAVVVTTAQQTARETFIRMRKNAGTNVKSSSNMSSISSSIGYETNASGDEEEIMTVMLGLDDVDTKSATYGRTPSINASLSIPNGDQSLPQTNYSWRCRIGDDLPTFSERRKYLRSRSMPPPTPLLLSSTGRKSTVASRIPVVETVIDTPGNAIKKIQEQLSKFEEPKRDSLGSLLRHIPKESSRLSTMANDDRLGLLQNLEDEIGQQENHWMRMQHNFDRDSNYSFIIMSRNDEQKPLPSPPSEESSRRSSTSGRSSTSETERPRVQSNLTVVSRNVSSARTSSSQGSEVSRASVWQKRLAEAQIEFMENAPALLASRNINFLAFSQRQQGSPTPPDSLNSESDSATEMDCATDEETYEHEISTGHVIQKTEWKCPGLWEARAPAPVIRVGNLWSHTLGNPRVANISYTAAPRIVRASVRRESKSTSITSSSLWSKPLASAKSLPVGLWGSCMSTPKSMTRPKTLRPQRKLRRVTFLPDILESPIPLPHKHDTLGIFRFPWGEKSDSASYNPIPVPNYAALHDLLVMNSSTYLQNKPLPLPPHLAEYSSSFLDDYGDDYDDVEENSDDEFDESTLWEIANLLDSRDVPSRNSLLPSPQIIDDYDDNKLHEVVDEEIEVQTLRRPAMVKFIPIQPLRPVTPPTLPLWTANSKPDAPSTKLGLPQPEDHVWRAYMSPLNKWARSRTPASGHQQPLPKIDSRELWTKAIRAVTNIQVHNSAALWTQKSAKADDEKPSTLDGISSKADPQAQLWTPRERNLAEGVIGLFAVGSHRTDYRRSNQAPAATVIPRKAGSGNTPVPNFKSQKLWSASKDTTTEHNWISRLRVGESCPSLYFDSSPSSSGRSSPASELLAPNADDMSISGPNAHAPSLWDLESDSTIQLTEEPASYLPRLSSPAASLAVTAVQSPVKTTASQPSEYPTPTRGSIVQSGGLWVARALSRTPPRGSQSVNSAQLWTPASSGVARSNATALLWTAQTKQDPGSSSIMTQGMNDSSVEIPAKILDNPRALPAIRSASSRQQTSRLPVKVNGAGSIPRP